MAGEPKEELTDEQLELLALQGYCELAQETLQELSDKFKNLRRDK